jgi:CDGSH-type Zn-finger protein
VSPLETGARITVYPDGPLIVRGDFVLDDVDGVKLPTGRSVALCRCGRSATKPLCDGSHKNSRRALSVVPDSTPADGAQPTRSS